MLKEASYFKSTCTVTGYVQGHFCSINTMCQLNNKLNWLWWVPIYVLPQEIRIMDI